MPSGVRVSRAVKREFFDLICLGMATTEASVKSACRAGPGGCGGADAGAMKLRNGYGGLGGLATAGDLNRPGGRGHRVSFEERMEIMRGRDAGLSFAEIAVRIGRDRSVVWREYKRNYDN